MEIGLYTFADIGSDPATGHSIGAAERLRNLVEEITLADQAGLDVFGLGEHHRPDYAASAVAVALAGAATQTKRIRLTSAVTVLGSEDPVRVFQQFATLDNMSGGRAEIMAGRGAFIESFPLFGYDLNDYDALFIEKLRLLLDLTKSEHVTWPGGRHTHPIDGLGVYPRPVQDPLPVWVAVGGTPQSALRTATLGLPMAMALILGSEWRRIAPVFDLYREAGRKAGHPATKLKTSLNVHGFVAGSMKEAIDVYYPAHVGMGRRMAAERGFVLPGREQFVAGTRPAGGYFIGGPSELTEKILATHERLGFDRLLIQMSLGVLPHRDLLKAIDILGSRVIPEVRKAMASKP